MNKFKRKLKVIRVAPDKAIPCLLLKGSWLEKAGFAIGVSVDVHVVSDCLVIVPAKGSEK